jgi:bacterioferritin (cytochrome b1)
MSSIDLQAEYEASNNYAQAVHACRATKDWFSCDHQRRKKRMDQAEAVLEDIRSEGYARMSIAKSVAGLFSEVGVGEVVMAVLYR